MHHVYVYLQFLFKYKQMQERVKIKGTGNQGYVLIRKIQTEGTELKRVMFNFEVVQQLQVTSFNIQYSKKEEK